MNGLVVFSSFKGRDFLVRKESFREKVGVRATHILLACLADTLLLALTLVLLLGDLGGFLSLVETNTKFVFRSHGWKKTKLLETCFELLLRRALHDERVRVHFMRAIGINSTPGGVDFEQKLNIF